MKTAMTTGEDREMRSLARTGDVDAAAWVALEGAASALAAAGWDLDEADPACYIVASNPGGENDLMLQVDLA